MTSIDELRLLVLAKLAAETGEDVGPDATLADARWALARGGYGLDEIETPEGTVAVRDLFPDTEGE